jgi:hypothetical protein
LNNVATSAESEILESENEEMVTGSKLSTVVPAQRERRVAEMAVEPPGSHDRASADKVFTEESRSTES